MYHWLKQLISNPLTTVIICQSWLFSSLKCFVSPILIVKHLDFIPKIQCLETAEGYEDNQENLLIFLLKIIAYEKFKILKYFRLF